METTRIEDSAEQARRQRQDYEPLSRLAQRRIILALIAQIKAEGTTPAVFEALGESQATAYGHSRLLAVETGRDGDDDVRQLRTDYWKRIVELEGCCDEALVETGLTASAEDFLDPRRSFKVSQLLTKERIEQIAASANIVAKAMEIRNESISAMRTGFRRVYVAEVDRQVAERTLAEAQLQAEPVDKGAKPLARIRRFSDLGKERKLGAWVLRERLREKQIVIATGDSGSGKSTVLALLAISVAIGRDFAGSKTVQGNVLLVVGEDRAFTEMRLLAYAEHMKITDDERKLLDKHLFIYDDPVSVMPDTREDPIHQSILRDFGPKAKIRLTMFDTKSSTWGGDPENSNDENADYVAAIYKQFCNRYETAVLIVHHLTKGGKDQPQTSRGGGALINDSDGEWRFVGKPIPGGGSESVLSPGAKVRADRWTETRFKIESVTVDIKKYPIYVDDQGFRDHVSIAVYTESLAVVNAKRAAKEELAMLVLDDWDRNPSAKASEIALMRGHQRKGKPLQGDAHRLATQHQYLIDQRWATTATRVSKITGCERLLVTDQGRKALNDWREALRIERMGDQSSDAEE